MRRTERQRTASHDIGRAKNLIARRSCSTRAMMIMRDTIMIAIASSYAHARLIEEVA